MLAATGGEDRARAGGGRRILHADLDAFYASVEQRDRPELQGRPIAVGGGVILAASYEARRRGVQTAMNERQARRLCPELIVVPPRMERYSDASRAVFGVFDDLSPEVEALSIDEAFIDVTGLWRLVDPSERRRGIDVVLAERLRARVAAEVGLPISVGAASTKFLAKVASREAKPDGLLVVAPGEESAFLHPLPVDRLWGVGPVTAEALVQAGITTVGQLASLDPALLRAKVGRAAGVHLHALAHNRDPRTVEVGRRRRSVGSQRSFPAGSVGKGDVGPVVTELADRVARRLRVGRRVARTVTVRLRYGDYSAGTRSRTLAVPTDETDVVRGVAVDLVARSWPEIERRGLTRLGVAVAGLDDADAVQLSLPFGGADRQQLDAAVDVIRERFGTGSIGRSSSLGRGGVQVPLLPDSG